MLAEFTDTAIDFTEAEVRVAEADSEFELSLEDDGEDEEEPEEPTAPRKRKAGWGVADRPGGGMVERQATLRYYERLNPERMFPLPGVRSKKEIQEVVKRGVAQAQSQRFQVELDSLVEVEPVLPGCNCFPPKEQVVIGKEMVTVTFWVVPHVLGKVNHARVIVRQEGRILAEVPLEMRVAKQTLTLLLSGLSLVLPLVLMVLRHFHLDFESQAG